MTAVIGPIGIQYTDLGYGRITFFLTLEVILDVKKILERHGEVQRVIQFF